MTLRNADEFHAAHEFGRRGLLFFDELGGERQQVALDLDSHEFAAIVEQGRVFQNHLARRESRRRRSD